MHKGKRPIPLLHPHTFASINLAAMTVDIRDLAAPEALVLAFAEPFLVVPPFQADVDQTPSVRFQKGRRAVQGIGAAVLQYCLEQRHRENELADLWIEH